MAHSKTFKTDHNAGVSFELSDEEISRGGVLRLKAEGDRKLGIYSPFYNRSEVMMGDDLALYRYSWKKCGGSPLTLKEGIAARRSISGW